MYNIGRVLRHPICIMPQSVDFDAQGEIFTNTEDEILIEVKNLTKTYGKHKALDGVSFKVRNRKIYGLLGPNGAGKSTTMNILAGCLAPTDGTVVVNGYDICDNPIEAKKQIGYLPEIPPLFPDATPYEYLTFVAEAKGVKGETVELQVKEAMALTGLTAVADRIIRNLSKGYQQRVGIAQAILGNPDIVILDEPLVGLDPKQIIDIRALIKKLAQTKTVIISSHILAEISNLCDHIIIISDGKVVADNETEDLERDSMNVQILVLTVKGQGRAAADVLQKINGVTAVDIVTEKDGQAVLQVSIASDKDLRDEIFFAMADARLAVLSMEQREQSLEDVFLNLTGYTAPECEYDQEEEN